MRAVARNCPQPSLGPAPSPKRKNEICQSVRDAILELPSGLYHTYRSFNTAEIFLAATGTFTD